jgi:hypothetical protein
MRKLLFVLLLVVVTFAGCGGGDDGGTDTGGDDSGSAAGTSEEGSGGGNDTDFSGSGSGDFCDLARKYDEDFEDTGSASEPDDIKKEYQELTAAIDELNDEAPDEIKADVATVREAFSTFYETLEKYDFDFTKIPEEEAEQLDLDSADIEAASNRVESYFEKVCKIDSDDDGDTDGVIDDGATSGDEQAPDDSTEDTADDTTETTEG